MLSREGPKAAVGDVNGDGLEDIYIGGTSVHPGQLYLQTAEGKFEKKEEPGFSNFKEFEDEAVLFFDADHDGDLDLFIGPGGNNNQPSSRAMQSRLYKNDGQGNFTIDAGAFGNNLNAVNTAVAIAYDFNHDGFPDLFVGGRSVPRTAGRGRPDSPTAATATRGCRTNRPSRAACRNAAMARPSPRPYLAAKSSTLTRQSSRSCASRTARSMAATESALPDCRSTLKRASVSLTCRDPELRAHAKASSQNRK